MAHGAVVGGREEERADHDAREHCGHQSAQRRPVGVCVVRPNSEEVPEDQQDQQRPCGLPGGQHGCEDCHGDGAGTGQGGLAQPHQRRREGEERKVQERKRRHAAEPATAGDVRDGGLMHL